MRKKPIELLETAIGRAQLKARAKAKPAAPAAPDIRELERKARTLDRIHAELDGKEWDADLMSVVASHLIGAGYKIRAPFEGEEGDDDAE